MASATKERSAWDEAVEYVRGLVAEMPELHRTAVSEVIEDMVGNPSLMMRTKDLNSRAARDELLGEIPLSLDDLANYDAGTPTTFGEVGSEIRTLALEVRAL